jgi:nitrous oxidase accessory protein NosD
MKKQLLIVGIVFLFVLMSFTSISGNQINNQIVKTSDRGNILFVGGSGPGNYTTIQSAINDAKNGDTVFVFNGLYDERIIVNRSIDVIGESNEDTIINSVSGNTVVKIVDSGVSFENFKITASTYSGPENAGIHMRPSNEITVSNNVIFSAFYYGILGETLDDSLIIRNEILHSEIGIRIKNSQNNVINRNMIIARREDQGSGIWLSYSHFNVCEYNDISDFVDGITFINSYSTRIYHNNFRSLFRNGLYFVTWDFEHISDFFVWNNYYSDWIGLKNPSLLFLPYLFFRGISSEDFYWAIPIPAFDWNPAKQPFDIYTTQGCDVE